MNGIGGKMKKRLTIEVDHRVHTIIKSKASAKGKSIKDYILEALKKASRIK